MHEPTLAADHLERRDRGVGSGPSSAAAAGNAISSLPATGGPNDAHEPPMLGPTPAADHLERRDRGVG